MFDPDARVASAQALAIQIEEALDQHPLAGTINVRCPGRLMVTRMIDGTLAIAHVRADRRSDLLPEHYNPNSKEWLWSGFGPGTTRPRRR